MLKCERETVINTNDEDTFAEIESYQAVFINKIVKLAKQFPDDVTIIEEQDEPKRIVARLPKKWVRLQAAPRYTDEQKQAFAERLKGYSFSKTKE